MVTTRRRAVARRTAATTPCAKPQMVKPITRREIEPLLRQVGATLEPISGARTRMTLNRMEGVLHRPHHSNTLDAKSILHLRGFLARAGVTPSQYESGGEGPT